MLQFSLKDVAEDFGIAMRMLAKSLARLDHIVIDDT